MYINPDAKELSNRRPVTVLNPVRYMTKRYNPNLIINVLTGFGYSNKSKNAHLELKEFLGTLPRHVISNMVLALRTFEARAAKAKYRASAPRTGF
jgi:hypothetical protein